MDDFQTKVIEGLAENKAASEAHWAETSKAIDGLGAEFRSLNGKLQEVTVNTALNTQKIDMAEKDRGHIWKKPRRRTILAASGVGAGGGILIAIIREILRALNGG